MVAHCWVHCLARKVGLEQFRNEFQHIKLCTGGRGEGGEGEREGEGEGRRECGKSDSK